MVPERELSESSQAYGEIKEFLSDAQLMKKVIDVGPYYPKLVKEFIVNFSDDLNKPNNPDFKQIHVRGHYFSFSMTIINDYSGRDRIVTAYRLPPMSTILDELIGDDNMDWPKKVMLGMFPLC